jgi:hypothetical protein
MDIVITMIVYFTMIHPDAGISGETHIQMTGFKSLAACEADAEELAATLDNPDVHELAIICVEDK